MDFIFGVIVGSFILEPIVINFIYFSNIGLFHDIILTEKNRNKLRDFYIKKGWENDL